MSENDFIGKGNKAFRGGKSIPPSSSGDKEDVFLKKVSDYTDNLKVPSSSLSNEEKWSNIQERVSQTHFQIEHNTIFDKFIQSKVLTRVAAIIGVFVGLYTLWFFSNDIEQISPKDGTLEYVFPDGSVAILKKGSSIQFLKVGFDGHIYLDGHAQFYINDDGDNDDIFEVKTDRSVIYATDGAKFDLRDDQHIFQLTNIGNENIEYHEEHSIEKEVKVLEVGHLIETFTTNLTLPFMRDLGHTNWVNGDFAYIDVPLIMVIEDLEKQFGVIVDHQLHSKKISFTGGFHDENIEDALTSICKELPLNYILKGEKILLTMK